jgi:hypothetical protein
MMCLRGYMRVGQLRRERTARKPRSLGSLGDRSRGTLDGVDIPLKKGRNMSSGDFHSQTSQPDDEAATDAVRNKKLKCKPSQYHSG